MKKLIVLALVLGMVGSAFGTLSENFNGLGAGPWTNLDGTDNGAGLPDFTNSNFDNTSYGGPGSVENQAFSGPDFSNSMHATASIMANGRIDWSPAGYVDEMLPIVDLSLDFKLGAGGLEGDPYNTDARIMVGWHAGGDNYIDLWFQVTKNANNPAVWGRELWGTIDPDAGYLEDAVAGYVPDAWNTMEMRIDQNAGPHGETSVRLNSGPWTTIPRSLYDIESLGLNHLEFTINGQVWVDNISITGTPEPATIALYRYGRACFDPQKTLML